MIKSTGFKSWALLIVLSLIWGSSFILIKKGLTALTPMEVGSLRIAIAALILVPTALMKVKKVPRSKWKFLLAVGLTGSLLPSILFAFAQTEISSSITGVLNVLVPIFTVLIGMWVYGVKQHANTFIGVAIGFTGAGLLVTFNTAVQLERLDFSPYAFLIILATLLYATNLNLIKYHLSDLHPLIVTSLSLMLVGPTAIIQLLFFTNFIERLSPVDQSTLFSISAVALLGIAGTSVALVLFNRLVQLTDPVFTSSVTYIIPIVAVAWGLLDGEVLGVLHLIGILLILIGVYTINRTGKKSKEGSAGV